MCKTRFFVFPSIIVGIILLLIGRTETLESRAIPNPLNGKAIDLFIAVDETNEYMNAMQLGLTKTALNTIAMYLNPSGSSPYFGVYFYGASTEVDRAVPFLTGTASAVKTYLDTKQYRSASLTKSTLTSALNAIDFDCRKHIRPSAPQVTLVITSILDSAAESALRELERVCSMTVLVVGIGLNVNITVLNEMVSHPARYYAIHVLSVYELILASDHISSVISDVPRQLNFNTNLNIPTTAPGTYYTIRLNTYEYINQNDTIIMFATNCPSCGVYGSLSEPNPTAANAIQNTNYRPFTAYPGYPNCLYYFVIPINTDRFYVSFLGNGMKDAKIWCDVFTLPIVMQK